MLDGCAKRIGAIIHGIRFCTIYLQFPYDLLTELPYGETMKNPAYIAPPLRYFSGLVRIWQVRNEGQAVWRASLEDPHTHERISFADVDGLIAYLRMHTTDSASTPASTGGGKASQ